MADLLKKWKRRMGGKAGRLSRCRALFATVHWVRGGFVHKRNLKRKGRDKAGTRALQSNFIHYSRLRELVSYRECRRAFSCVFREVAGRDR